MSVRSLRTVTELAAQQAEFLKQVVEQDDDEIAYLSVIKLQEEVGEVAEAFLALRKVQRRDKLQGSTSELRASLGREIGDATIVLSLLADAVAGPAPSGGRQEEHMSQERQAMGPSPDLTQAPWRKSSLSGNGSDCVEVAFVDDVIAVRDSKNPTGAALIFTHSEWDAFLGGVKRDEFTTT